MTSVGGPALRRCMLKLLPRCGHLPHEESPEELLAGPDTDSLSQLNFSSCVSVTTQLIPLIHFGVLKLS